MYENPTVHFNPYEHNQFIIKNYFRKPIILVQGILYIISALFTFFVSILSMQYVAKTANYIISEILSYIPDDVMNDLSVVGDFSTTNSTSINFGDLLMPVLLAVAFMLIYFKSKDNHPLSSPKTGITILYVVSIIKLIAVIVACVFMLLAVLVLFLSVSAIKNDPQFSDVIGILYIILIALFAITFITMPFALLYSINEYRYFKSIKNGLTSIALTYKGAFIYGIFNIIGGVCSALGGLGSITSGLVAFTSNQQLVPGLYMSDLAPLYIFTGVASLITAAIYLINGIVAIGYRNYIKNITSGYNTMDNEQAVNVQPFMPQPIPQAQPVNNDAINIDPLTCPYCKSRINEDTIFCNSCGSKVK